MTDLSVNISPHKTMSIWVDTSGRRTRHRGPETQAGHATIRERSVPFDTLVPVNLNSAQLHARQGAPRRGFLAAANQHPRNKGKNDFQGPHHTPCSYAEDSCSIVYNIERFERPGANHAA